MNKTRDQIQKEALDVALENDRCTLAISMGVGKTYIGLQHLEKIWNPAAKYLVVAPKKSIIQTWKDEAHRFNLSHLLANITFTTYLSLNKQETGVWSCIYLDECHSLLYSHEFFLLSHQGPILGLTGTAPTNSASEKYKMIQRFCPVKYVFDVEEATQNNILNDYKIIVHMLSLDTTRNIRKTSKDGKTWFTSESDVYDFWSNKVDNAHSPKDRQITSVMRMKAMQDFPSKERYAAMLIKKVADKCIVFANTQDQADRLSQHSYHSTNPNSEANLELFKKDKILNLSCVLQLSEGVSIPNLKSGIILHAYGNNRKSAQRIGRLLRLNPSQTAVCHILCHKNTVDYQWVRIALESFNADKILMFDTQTKTYSKFYEYSAI